MKKVLLFFLLVLFAYNFASAQKKSKQPLTLEQVKTDFIWKMRKELYSNETIRRRLNKHPKRFQYPALERFALVHKKETIYDFLKWYNMMKPRLYPSGEFKTAIQAKKLLTYNDTPALKMLNDCDISVSWENIGPFFKQSGADTNTDASNVDYHTTPYPGIGRVKILKKHPSNNTLYLGASGGGLWKSTDNGVTWAELNSGLSILGISDIAFSNDATKMYLATGDASRGAGNIIGTSVYSEGVLVSEDDGNTWQRLATNVTWEIPGGTDEELIQAALLKINRLIVASNGDLLIGTSENFLTDEVDSGIWKYNTTNNRWEIKQITADAQAIVDMEVLNDGTILAAAENGKIYRSTNNGDSFSLVSSSNLPNTSADSNGLFPISRVGIETQENITYLVFIQQSGEFRRLVKSVDSGSSFEIVTIPNDNFTDTGLGRADIRLGFTINPNNSEELYISGSEAIWKITVSGSTGDAISLTNLNSWEANYVHPDVHHFEWIGTSLFVGHDGGVSRTDDYGANWTKWYELTTDLCISEFYSAASLPSDPNILYGGTHDCGVFKYDFDAVQLDSDLDAPPQWTNIKEGDMTSVIPVSRHEAFALYFPDGQVFRLSQTADWNWSDLSTIASSIEETSEDGIKFTLVRNYTDNALFIGHENLFKSTDQGASWVNKTMTIPAINDNNNPITAIELCANAPQNMYFAKQGHSNFTVSEPFIFKSTNGGDVSTTVYNPSINTGLPNLYLNRLAIHPNNPNKLWAVFSGYEDGKKVYQSEDGGTTWRNISANLPNLPINAIAVFLTDVDATAHLVIGSDLGVYYTNETYHKTGCNEPNKWVSISDGFPNAIVQDLEVVAVGTERKLRAATFGRGIWETTLTMPEEGCTCYVAIDDCLAIEETFYQTNNCIEDPSNDNCVGAYYNILVDPLNVDLTFSYG